MSGMTFINVSSVFDVKDKFKLSTVRLVPRSMTLSQPPDNSGIAWWYGWSILQ